MVKPELAYFGGNAGKEVSADMETHKRKEAEKRQRM